MHPFTLSSAVDPASAISAAQDPHLAFIAGGTDLIGLMKDRAARPERLLDINGLPDMDHIEPTSDGGLRICALARMSDVAADIESSAPSKKNQCWLVTREERKTVWAYRRKNLAPRSSLRRTYCNAFPLLARARLPWPIGGCPTTGLQDDQDS
jgi:hypothetical protein